MTPRVLAVTVVRVVDGDTIMVDCDLGWRLVRQDEPVRIANISCRESTTPEGKAATAYARTLVAAGAECRLTVLKWSDKYGRTLGLLLLDDGRDFGAAMLEAGQARPGDGRQGLIHEAAAALEAAC